MYRETDISEASRWRRKFSQMCLKACLPGMLCLALVGMQALAIGMPVAYASPPGGTISDPAVRAVDIAKPAIVRIITQLVGQVTVKFSNGQSATFPLTPQQGLNGYPLALSGSGTFISAHGDLLTADHVINPVTDDKQALDQDLDRQAAPDVANYINQKLQPAQPATAGQVTQELTGGQLQSTTQYQKPRSQVYLSTDFSGPITTQNFGDLPPSQLANVDQIKGESLTTQKDVAIIHVSGMDNMPMLQIGDSTAVQQQDQLTVLGFPGIADVSTTPTSLLTSSIVTVSVSALKPSDTGAPLIQVDGNVQQGDSGGPALNSGGQIVGVVSSGIPGTPTSFLQASSSAEQLIRAARIDTTPSLFQQAWSKAFTDYGASVPGHWHQSAHEFQQIATQYPQFKAVSPFLSYATQQAQTEKQTQESSTGTPVASNTTAPVAASAGLNPMFIIIGGVVVLILLVLVLALSRRRKPATAVATGYGVAPTSGAPNLPGQSYGAFPANAPGAIRPPVGQSLPQTPGYPGQSGYQPQPSYGNQAGQPAQPAGPAPQPGYRPQPAPVVPQQSYRPAQPQQPGAAGMAPFGAPVPVTPPTSSAGPDVTLVARPGKSVPQWRTWPCGHINREDARFCGTCGESAPPAPLVRRVEQ